MMKWFHKLRIAHKLALVSVVFMIPDSIMLYLFITSINANIDIARLEQTGDEYQRAVEPLLKLVPEHRLLVRTDAVLLDNAELNRVRGEIDRAFDTLSRVDGRIGAVLEFTPEGLQKRNRSGAAIRSVRDAWNRLRADCDHMPADTIDQRHLEMISNLRAMIAHAGDTSNLILDPELDSYYLMDTTLLALPQTQDRLAQIVIDGLKRFRVDGPGHDENTTLAIDLALLRHDDLERVQSSTQTALTNGNPSYGQNEHFNQRVSPLLKDYCDTTTRFCEMIARLQTLGPAALSEAELIAAGRAAREASFRLWFAADKELDNLLQRRIDYYTFRRWRSLAVAACAVLGAALLVTFITRSISGPLKRQAAELGRAYREAQAERKLAEYRLVLQQKAETDLRAAQDQLVTASRQAGMAEVATGVLHNVGNVLTSVNVSVHQLRDAVQASPVPKLARAVALIDAHEQDLGEFLTADPRGKFIPGYVSELARLLSEENVSMLKEVENLSRGVDHIKQVVQFQQSYAKPSTIFEMVEPAELLDDALRLNMIALDRHGVTIVRDLGDVGPVSIDKHKTLQILVNLISNAKNAMSDLNGNQERRLFFKMSAAQIGQARHLRIAVQDNGVGIAAENISRIFAHGFTTRADGHGFGLHSAANAAREMGGTLEAFSAGPGRGATFTLELPLTVPAEVAA